MSGIVFPTAPATGRATEVKELKAGFNAVKAGTVVGNKTASDRADVEAIVKAGLEATYGLTYTISGV